MKEMYLPEAENDFLFTFLGNPFEVISLAAALIFAVLLFKFFLRKK